MKYKNYDNKVEYIKNEYKNFYVDKGPENGILQGTKYVGAATHARNCLFTLVKMIEPKYALEIGSMHYASSDSMANAMDEIYGVEGEGVVDTFDIKYGGYTGDTQEKPKNKRVRPGYWYPFHTTCDEWKYTDPLVVHPDFKDMTNEEIREKNASILDDRVKDFDTKYDIIFVDGDHSFEGAKEDCEMALRFAHEDTLIVIDNVWDSRLAEVRRYYDSITQIKWDFEEWNDEHYSQNMVMDNAIFIP